MPPAVVPRIIAIAQDNFEFEFMLLYPLSVFGGETDPDRQAD
jgi:hypothetical protein